MSRGREYYATLKNVWLVRREAGGHMLWKLL